MIKPDLKQQFFQGIEQAREISLCTIDTGSITHLWEILIDQYTQPHRYYHNLSHIQAMLNHFKKHKQQLQNPLVVIFAIYYHDVIYQTDFSINPVENRKSNECLSAEFFVDQLCGCFQEGFIQQVVELILMTEKHKLKTTMMNDINDAQLFLDIDLGVLGQPPKTYQTYAKAIRQEYAHVMDKDYQKGRIDVLVHFLKRERIYFSEAFFTKYEYQARKNLQAEITHLSHQA